MQFYVRRYNRKTGRNGSTYKASMIWNSIPNKFKDAENSQILKTLLNSVRQTMNYLTFEKGINRFLNKEKDFKYY